MNTSRRTFGTGSVILMLLLSILVACGPEATAEPQVIEVEVTVVVEREVEVEVTRIVEGTPVVETVIETVVETVVEVVTATPEPQPTDVPAGFPVRGGTLRTEYAWMPYVEDPAADGVGTGYVGLSIAESLVWVGEDAVPRPQLAKSWEANEDATVWTIRLQEGVTFNNGKPFGADDVIWNFLHWLDEDTDSSTAAKLGMLSPEGIKKIDDLTIELTLDRPNGDLMLVFYDYPTMIAPEGGWTDFYSGDPADAIGTGPFMMESFVPDERFVLVPNPNYWQLGEDGLPLPYVDKVIVTAGWDDAARLAALIGDGADRLSPGEAIIEELQKYPDEVDVQTFASGWITPIVARVDLEPFDDPNIMKALKLTQDRQQVKDLVQPLGEVAYDHWILPSAGAYCPDTDTGGLPQDIEGAIALLAESGYGPDNPLQLTLATADDGFRPAYAQVFKEQAALAGVEVTIDIRPSDAFWDQWAEWPFSISGWSGRIPPTANINLALRCEAAWSEAYYCNEELDAVLDAVDSAVDIEEKRELYCQIQEIMQEDAPYLIPFFAVEFAATRKGVHYPDDWSRGGYLWHLTWLESD
jgi:peptide/nickel transport system substrate-binding protein